MAEAAATRPSVVGETLNGIAKQDPEVLDAVLQVMENEQLIASGADVDVLPGNVQVLVSLTSPGSAPSQPVPAASSAWTPGRPAQFKIDDQAFS
jgi:hypothetical protein